MHSEMRLSHEIRKPYCEAEAMKALAASCSRVPSSLRPTMRTAPLKAISEAMMAERGAASRRTSQARQAVIRGTVA